MRAQHKQHEGQEHMCQGVQGGGEVAAGAETREDLTEISCMQGFQKKATGVLNGIAELPVISADGAPIQIGRNKLYRGKRRVREIAQVKNIIGDLPPPGGPTALEGVTFLDDLEGGGSIIDWDALPASCDPRRFLQSKDPSTSGRAMRKRWQVESFCLLLRRLLSTPQRQKVVDFGCGTGCLVVPLAHLFPAHQFVGLDMKAQALRILEDRALAAGVQNLSTVLCMVEHYDEPFDVSLALHACGNATDHALLQAQRRRAAYIVSPCCVGKLKFSMAGGPSFRSRRTKRERGVATVCDGQGKDAAQREGRAQRTPQVRHPRSQWMRTALREPEQQFKLLAKIGDFALSTASTPTALEEDAETVSRLCKLHLEIDRNEAAKEVGYRVGLFKAIHHDRMAKGDVLAGVPEERIEWQEVWAPLFCPPSPRPSHLVTAVMSESHVGPQDPV
ncbi:unnamed protein product [Ostreobium quekettii]|uniref:Methyltransferase domain-containing protein n=1 Tax=Ostreobium quekettii TaxID=121088 RepID=A0A8S1J896_9CHLO|nr:unnamed protein product [Ostreobium quekettii]